MLQILLISVFVTMFIRDSLSAPLAPGPGRLWVGVVSLVLMASVGLVGHFLIWRQARRMDTGEYRAVRRADAVAAGMRGTGVAVHAYLVLVLGWLDAVRGTIGDVVLLDELLTAMPVLSVFVASWWSMYQVDHRLREAALIGDLDQGRPIRPMPTRGAYVAAALRHQAALVLAPVVCLLAWNEVVALASMGRWGELPEWFPWIGVQFAGMAVILLFMPVAIRWIWDTTRLGAGPLRERLEAMCAAHRIRVRELLVWRTHGTMINGAVMGFFGPVRYILLTDALLDLLPMAQVEAVTAHELGHVKRRHMPWLAAAAISGIMVTSAAGALLLEATGAGWARTEWASTLVAVGALLVGLVLFGIVSRRFEWQADAFAVQHLSGYRRGERVLLTEEAVVAMAGALESVARLNQIPRERFSWRHGSIASRQRRLRAMVGLPADRLWADRAAGIAKIAAATGLLASGVIVAASRVS